MKSSSESVNCVAEVANDQLSSSSSSSEPNELLCGHLPQHVEVDIKVGAPESPYSSPDVGREAGTGDAMEYPGYGAARQYMFAGVQVYELVDVPAYRVLIFTVNLERKRDIPVYKFIINV